MGIEKDAATIDTVVPAGNQTAGDISGSPDRIDYRKNKDASGSPDRIDYRKNKDASGSPDRIDYSEEKGRLRQYARQGS